ncbi:MAG: hypothetical protein JKY86_09660, partial [Gammaproteobacteria bacterium]|nr:hypothetical protein [Gammaproteobacteria bacterium]
IEWMTMYYDPIAKFKVNIPGTGGTGAGTAFYLMPQSPEIATQIYEATANSLGWRDPRQEIRPSATGLAMAKALGDYTAVSRLSAAAERYSDPKWFGDDMDKFGWWFNNEDPWPRGQPSAQQMISEISEGNWVDAFKVQHLDKYTAPTLEGVDYPTLGVDTAWNDKDSGVLHIGTYVADRSRAGESTSWQIVNLPNAAEVIVICDGTTVSDVQVLNANTIRVPSDIGQHQFQVYTGYFGQEIAMARPDPSAFASAATVSATRRTAEQNVKAAETVIASGATGCPCCAGVT